MQGPLSVLVGLVLIAGGIYAKWWGVIVLPMGLFWTWASIRGWQSALRKTNWLMRIRENEVLIKFRSFANWRFPEDEPQIIALDSADVAFARGSRSTRLTMYRTSSYSKVTQKKHYLDIALNTDNTAAVKQALETERRHPGWGNRVLTTRVDDDTVFWVEPNILRFDFEQITPKLEVALRQLGALTKIVVPTEVDEDYSTQTLRLLDPTEQRRRLTILAQSDRLAAFNTIQSLYQCSGSEATRMIEEFRAAAADNSANVSVRRTTSPQSPE